MRERRVGLLLSAGGSRFPELPQPVAAFPARPPAAIPLATPHQDSLERPRESMADRASYPPARQAFATGVVQHADLSGFPVTDKP
jgi:hypothetical protein